jgi:hypothetical protein
MSTVIRAEVSQKNQYTISKHRYYELVHFCLQYPEWQKKYKELNLENQSPKFPRMENSKNVSKISQNMKTVDEALDSIDKSLRKYVKIGVTEGRAYPYLQSVMNIPCCRVAYYELYRKFFWTLDKLR